MGSFNHELAVISPSSKATQMIGGTRRCQEKEKISIKEKTGDGKDVLSSHIMTMLACLNRVRFLSLSFLRSN